MTILRIHYIENEQISQQYSTQSRTNVNISSLRLVYKQFTCLKKQFPDRCTPKIVCSFKKPLKINPEFDVSYL
jgi:hypothetical protein